MRAAGYWMLGGLGDGKTGASGGDSSTSALDASSWIHKARNAQELAGLSAHSLHGSLHPPPQLEKREIWTSREELRKKQGGAA